MQISEHVWTPPHLRWPRGIRLREDIPLEQALEQAFDNADRLQRGIDAWAMAVKGRVGPTPFPVEALEVE